ncbi:AMP-binding protein, partial [Cronobacter sakazakii]|uniref:AMP-binding protein n=1 Tax=Cronobacter sakazakii TaxID=28141 RepID=UPI00131A4778
FTSGTTGTPKAFIRSQKSWVASFQCNRCDFHLDNTKHVLIPGSLFHSHFLYGAVSTLYLGGSVYIMEQFTPQLTMQFLNQHPISVLYVLSQQKI